MGIAWNIDNLVSYCFKRMIPSFIYGWILILGWNYAHFDLCFPHFSHNLPLHVPVAQLDRAPAF